MIFAFSEFEVDLALCELRRGGASVAVQPKVFRLLAYLVLHQDRVVPKDELLGALWPDEVVGDGSLTRAVRGARLALGDGGDSQRMIRTIRRFGYRFVQRAHTRPALDGFASIVSGRGDRARTSPAR